MPDHAVQRLYGIRCVDHLADVCRVSEERRQVGPVCLPAPAYLRVAAVPCAGERFQRLLACFFHGSLIDGFQVASDGFVVLPGDEPQAVTHHMHDAQLNAGFRIHGVDGVRKAFQTVDTGDEDIRSDHSFLVLSAH